MSEEIEESCERPINMKAIWLIWLSDRGSSKKLSVRQLKAEEEIYIRNGKSMKK